MSTPHSQQGIAMIEFLIVAPILLLVMLAMVELGQALQQYNTLNKALRDGARYASAAALEGSTGVPSLEGAWVAQTRNLVVYGSIAGGGTAVLPSFTTDDVTVALADDEHVRVTASYTYQPIFAVIPTFGFGPGNITPSFTFDAAMTVRAL